MQIIILCFRWLSKIITFLNSKFWTQAMVTHALPQMTSKLVKPECLNDELNTNFHIKYLRNIGGATTHALLSSFHQLLNCDNAHKSFRIHQFVIFTDNTLVQPITTSILELLQQILHFSLHLHLPSLHFILPQKPQCSF